MICELNEIFFNKNNWIKTTGGISNDVYYYEYNNNKYIIKLLNKENNNLFVIFDNYIKILENLDTTLYIDKIQNIIIEKFIDGNIIENEILFSKIFLEEICNKIDKISIIEPNIPKYNIIVKYIKLLKNYIEENKIFINEIEIYNKIFDDINLEELEKKYNNLFYCHNDIQKFNIINSMNNYILIDWEYAGYTFQYFDQCNFVVLMYYQYIIDVDELFMIDFYTQYIKIRYNIDEKYIYRLMIISCYTWLLWSYVKYDKSKDNFYLEYKNYLVKIFYSIYEKYKIFK